MEKDLKYGVMLDLYGGLLTEKQVMAMDYYYNSDYSLAEIAELMDITRQGVRDFIKRGEAVLTGAEERLRLYSRFAGLERISRCAVEILELGGGKEINILAERIIKEAEQIRNGEK